MTETLILMGLTQHWLGSQATFYWLCGGEVFAPPCSIHEQNNVEKHEMRRSKTINKEILMFPHFS